MQEPTDTAAETGRNTDDDTTEIESTSEAFTPEDPWVDEFNKQLTPKLILSLQNYARPRVLAISYYGRKVDDYDTRAIVQDAIGDTWTGLLRWDPKRWTLEYHLMRAIQGRADKERKRAKDLPHDSIGDGTDASKYAESDASEHVADSEHAVQRVYSTETMAQVRALASRDKPLLRVLDAYDAGAQTKDDVLSHTKMKERTYHNAHLRLKRIVRNLTDRKLASKVRA